MVNISGFVYYVMLPGIQLGYGSGRIVYYKMSDIGHFVKFRTFLFHFEQILAEGFRVRSYQSVCSNDPLVATNILVDKRTVKGANAVYENLYGICLVYLVDDCVIYYPFI